MISPKFIQSVIKNTDSSLQTNAQSFRPGQIFNGKILKLYPNQLAEVQLGNQKVIAQLEVPLNANERYWFQVQPGEGKIHLKIITSLEGTPARDADMTFEGILKQFSIPATKENVELIRLLVKEQIPITRIGLQQAAEWIKGDNHPQESMEVIKQILTRDLPISKETFLSVKSSVDSTPLTQLLQELQNKLRTESHTEAGQKLEKLLFHLSSSEKEKISNGLITHIAKMWLNPEDEKAGQIALRLLQGFQFLSEGSEDYMFQNAIKNILNDKQSPRSSTGLLQGHNSIKELLNQSPENKEIIIKNWLHSQLNSTQMGVVTDKTLIREVLSLFHSNGNININDLEGLVARMTSFVTKGVNHQAGKGEQEAFLGLNEKELQQLDTILKDVIKNGTNWNDGKSVAEQLKTLIKVIGFPHETDVVHQLKNTNGLSSEKIESLKSLLIQVQNEEYTPDLKDSSEQLIHKITGLQLMTQNEGPMQQYVVQIPISFWEKTVDLTMQWNGRKKENGDIDPDYCRVIFYLNMEYLHETIVDLQVQNRIINISIMNENDQLKEIAAPFIKQLKDNLKSLDYHLSSLNFQKPVEKRSTGIRKQEQLNLYKTSNYGGVDFRV